MLCATARNSPACGIANFHNASEDSAGLRTLTELPRSPDFLICKGFMDEMSKYPGIKVRSGRDCVLLTSQIGGFHLGVCQQVGAGIGQHDLAGLDHVTVTGDLQGLAHVLFHEQH